MILKNVLCPFGTIYICTFLAFWHLSSRTQHYKMLASWTTNSLVSVFTRRIENASHKKTKKCPRPFLSPKSVLPSLHLRWFSHEGRKFQKPVNNWLYLFRFWGFFVMRKKTKTRVAQASQTGALTTCNRRITRFHSDVRGVCPRCLSRER